MIVVDHAPHAWYLLRDGDRWLLDVNCNAGLADISLLVPLSPHEIARLHASGHDGCDALAQTIRAAPTAFASRNADNGTQKIALAAILAWRRAQAASPT